jgi:protein ImuB
MFACLYRRPSTSGVETQDSTNLLIHLAREHSPKVELHGQALVVLDVSGLGQLWGSPRAVGQRLRRVAAENNLGVRVAVAKTKMAALLATQSRCGLTVIPPGGEADALSPLPLTVLKHLSQAQASGSSTTAGVRHTSHAAKTVSPAAASSLAVSVLMLLPVVQRWGIKTLGELAALPPAELFSRVGRGGLELQRIARGEDSRPFVSDPDEERFEQTMTLEWPVEGLEPLSFVLARILEPLCAHLARRGFAAGRLHVRLILVTRETHERTLEFPASVSDPKLLRTLIVLDLESHPPAAGIDRVTVRADPVPLRTQQFSLLERAVPSAECLSTLLARLTVLMGDQRCGAPVLVDTHHPGAFEMGLFAPNAQRPSSNPHASTAPDRRPILRRFRHPVPARVAVEHGHPVQVSMTRRRTGGRVVSSAGPWRSSGQWWMSSRTSWDRNEWDVELSDGGVYRIFRDRVSRRWFVEGMVD